MILAAAVRPAGVGLQALQVSIVLPHRTRILKLGVCNLCRLRCWWLWGRRGYRRRVDLHALVHGLMRSMRRVGGVYVVLLL